MAKTFTTSYPTAQDVIATVQPALVDGDTVLPSHVNVLASKLDAVAHYVGDASALPAGSLRSTHIAGIAFVRYTGGAFVVYATTGVLVGLGLAHGDVGKWTLTLAAADASLMLDVSVMDGGETSGSQNGSQTGAEYSICLSTFRGAAVVEGVVGAPVATDGSGPVVIKALKIA